MKRREISGKKVSPAALLCLSTSSSGVFDSAEISSSGLEGTCIASESGSGDSGCPFKPHMFQRSMFPVGLSLIQGSHPKPRAGSMKY